MSAGVRSFSRSMWSGADAFESGIPDTLSGDVPLRRPHPPICGRLRRRCGQPAATLDTASRRLRLPSYAVNRPALRDPHDAEILRLAVPAFGALVAEPLFLLVDSAIVGRLGTSQLAGLGIAGVALATAVNLCVFLAYGTTAAVARQLGAGNRAVALRRGVDGLWLAVLTGLVLAVAGVLAAPAVVDALGASARVHPYAVTYLRVSAVGLPAMLLVLAATGVLRGLQDTRTPLVVAVVASAVNAVLNAVFVLVLHWGIAGSAIGTVLAQCGSAAAYLVVLVPALRRYGVPLRFDRSAVGVAAVAGSQLLLRTISLRVVFVAATFVAARLGDAEVAAHQ